MDKSAKRKDDSTSLPTLAPEMMAVGPERPRQSQEEEGGGGRPRSAVMSIRRRDREEPLKPIPETSVFGPERARETEEKYDGAEES